MRNRLLASATMALFAMISADAASQERTLSSCAAMETASLPDARVLSARFVDPVGQDGMPGYCEIKAVSEGAAGSRIGVVYRLPGAWNGKMLGLGGGGLAGNVTLEQARQGLKRGYATAQTDGGHKSADPRNSDWTVRPDGHPDMVALTDFGNRAVHMMAVIGRQVVGRYYGKAPGRSYYQGCSTGGRWGLSEAQRYPQDFDGIIAGAPVYSLNVQGAEIWRNNVFASPGAALRPEQVALVQAATLRQCDRLDGLKDGVVTDPRACRWRPSTLQCRPGQTNLSSCLSAPQVDALNKAYATIRDGRGRPVVFGLGAGSESAWGDFTDLTRQGPNRNDMRLKMREAYFGNAEFDLSRFDPIRDVPIMRTTPLAKVYEASNPDISAFIQNGGKLILWHGFDDPGPSALNTIDYWERMRAFTGKRIGPNKLDKAAQFYLVPGVHHCGGGPGADQFDMLTALDRWVDSGVAPQQIVATKENAPMSRPLCRYPSLAFYSGKGDPNKASSFVCR